MRSLRDEKKEKRERREMRREKIDVKVSSRRETKRRNQMTLKAAFNYEDI